jgi:predicted Zn finger-like uncharacterized protein
MLRIACESCKAPYQVDERRVPPKGLKMRCPKCGTTFLVTLQGTVPLEAASQPPKQPQMTMVEGGEDVVKKAIAEAEARSGVAAKPSLDDLPAARPSPPKPGAARPAAPAAKPAAPAPKPAAPAAPAAPRPAGPPPLGAKPAAPRPGLPDPGLGDEDLPAARPSPPKPGAKPPPLAPQIAKPPAPAPKMSDFDLPAARPAPPKPGAKPAPAKPAPEVSEWDLPVATSSAPGLPQPKIGVKPPAPAPEVSEWDLPASTSTAPPVPPSTSAALKDASHFPPALGRLDDLPAPAASLPATKGKAAPPPSAPFGELDLGVDLPSPVAAGLPAPVSAGLPAPAASLPAPVIPATRAARRASGDFELDLGPQAEPSGFELDLAHRKPAPPPKKPAADDAFGELDLPSVGSALPAVADVLPVAASALPAVANALPAVAESLPVPQQSLPAPQPSLPANTKGGGGDLSFDLDAVPESLPPAFQASPKPVRPSAELSLSGFGEIDLVGGDGPPPPPSMPKPAPAPAGLDSGFGEIDLESAPPSGAGDSVDDLIGGVVAPPPLPPAAAAASAEPAPPKAATNALAFGELDLGGGGGGEASIPTEGPARPAPAAPELPLPGERKSGAPAATELSLPTAMPGSRPKRKEDDRPSRAPRIILAVFALLLAGGAALQLTKHGAFGYLTITDKLRADEYVKTTSSSAAAARDRMGKDTVVEARGAVDDLFAARGRTPRAKPLSAYAAFTTFAYEARFGADPQRDSRAKSYLNEVKDEADVKYLGAALAAQDAAAGNWDKAAKGLDAASKRDAGDPIQRDIAELRGFVALKLHDYAGAKASFDTALKLAPTARAHYGLAAAFGGLKDKSASKNELEATLAATPNHPAALVARAMLAYEQHDEKSAMADLAIVIDGAGKPLASTEEYADALAVRGFIQADRGRGGEARASFEAAIASDPNNVHALFGLGQVYYEEGRYTEALTRLDTALAKAPNDVKVIALDAMVKLKLERLKEAKDQIVAARVQQPKALLLALTLGVVEMALGNKAEAEKALAASVDLVTESDGTDGVSAYISYALFLAADGRTKDADAKLDDMKLKLPDSVEMQRMLGKYDATQGRFDGAVTHFRNAIELDPQDTSTRFQLAVTLRRMRHMDEAATEFDKVLAADKDYPGLALERGILYEESGEVEKALEQFKNALAKAPEDLDLTLRVGAAYVAIGRADDALPMLRKVLEKRPQSAEANHYLGRALLAKGGANMQEATRYLKHAVELDPNRAEYHLYLAWAANESNPVQLGLAEDEVTKALAIDKLLADGYWQRAVTERKKGAVEDALKDLKRALELKPGRIEAHATMAECYEDKNDEASALAEWQKAIAANDRVPYWRYRYGKLLFQHGNAAEASKHLVYAATEGEKGESRVPWLANSQFYAAESLRRMGRRDDAITYYEKFLSIAPTSSPDRRDAIVALSQLGKPYGADRR